MPNIYAVVDSVRGVSATGRCLLAGIFLLSFGLGPALGQVPSKRLTDLNAEVARLNRAQRYDESLSLAQSAVDLASDELGEHSPVYANTLCAFALVIQQTGDYSVAERMYLRALAIRQEHKAAQPAAYAATQRDLQALRAARKSREEELRQSEQEEIRREKEATLRSEQLSKQKEAQLRKEKEEEDYANKLADPNSKEWADYKKKAQAIGMSQAMLVITHPNMSKEDLEKLNAVAAAPARNKLATPTKEQSNPLLQSFLKKSPNGVDGTGITYNMQLLGKKVLLTSAATAQRQIMASKDPVLLQRFSRLQLLKRRFATACILPPAQVRQRGLDRDALASQVQKAEEELTKQLEDGYPGTGVSTITWQQVQKAIRPGQVAIEMWQAHLGMPGKTDTTAYLAMLLTPSAPPKGIRLGSGPQLEGRYLAAYHRLTHSPNGAGRGVVDANAEAAAAQTDAKALYRAYWQPIAKALPAGTKTVFFAGDGVYHQLNLSTLRNPATGKYLLDELDVHLVSSTRELAEPAVAVKHPTTGAVLVGAPAYRRQASASSATPARNRLPAIRSRSFWPAARCRRCRVRRGK